MAGEQQRGYYFQEQSIERFIFASDLFRKVKEVEEEELKEEELKAK